MSVYYIHSGPDNWIKQKLPKKKPLTAEFLFIIRNVRNSQQLFYNFSHYIENTDAFLFE